MDSEASSLRLFENSNRLRPVDGHSQIMKGGAANRSFRGLVHPLGHVSVKGEVWLHRKPDRSDCETSDCDRRHFDHGVTGERLDVFQSSPFRMLLVPFLKNRSRQETGGPLGRTAVVDLFQYFFRENISGAGIKDEIDSLAVDVDRNASKIGRPFAHAVRLESQLHFM